VCRSVSQVVACSTVSAAEHSRTGVRVKVCVCVCGSVSVQFRFKVVPLKEKKKKKPTRRLLLCLSQCCRCLLCCEVISHTPGPSVFVCVSRLFFFRLKCARSGVFERLLQGDGEGVFPGPSFSSLRCRAFTCCNRVCINACACVCVSVDFAACSLQAKMCLFLCHRMHLLCTETCVKKHPLYAQKK